MNFQFITHHTEQYTYRDSARMALEGGCRWIQLRMKEASTQEIITEGQYIRNLCRLYGAMFLLDDHAEMVKRLFANGVHLGKDDMPVAEARKMLGNGAIIGATAHTLEDIRRLCRDGADYIGCGPFRFTTTKKNLGPVVGLEGYRTLVRQMQEAGIDRPLIAIGGITYDDIPALMETGVSGIALSGSILRADDPVAETRRIIQL